MTKMSPLRGSPQPVSRCCAPTCGNSSDNTNGVSFFRFPKDEERCKKWVANCGRVDLQNKPAEKLFANYRLCSAHFKRESFSSAYRNRLVWNAVPTVFKHAPKTGGGVNVAAKPRAGVPGSQLKYRRFFGFASKRRTSVQLRPGAQLHPAVSCQLSPDQYGAHNRRKDSHSKETEERPRLPVYIEDHLYAVNALLPSAYKYTSGSSMPQGMSKFPQVSIDANDHDQLVINVMDGEDADAFKAAVEAVEAALPLLQLSQTPITLDNTSGILVKTTTTAPTTGVITSTSLASSKSKSGQLVASPSAMPRAAVARTSSGKVRKGPRLMQDFLLPHLDIGTFGERLQWVDRSNGVFQIGWYHKNAAQWTNDDCVVFLEWDMLKKRPVAQTPQYWMEAKQRFRAALGKVTYGWTQPRCKRTGAELKNVKVRKIRWTQDMTPPLGWHWQPWRPPEDSSPVSAAGRVHRPTISRVQPLFPPPDSDGDEQDADCGINGGLAVCHRCGYTTRNQRVFLRHRMMHRDVRAFCCRYCPQRFCLPESLFLHLQVHTERHPYTCSSCKVRTRLLLQLWRHELRRLAQKLCLCHRCGLVCHMQQNLRQHLLKAHGISRKTKPRSAAQQGISRPCSNPLGNGMLAASRQGFAKPQTAKLQAVKAAKSQATTPQIIKAVKAKGTATKPGKPRANAKASGDTKQRPAKLAPPNVKVKNGKPSKPRAGKTEETKAGGGKAQSSQDGARKAADRTTGIGKATARKTAGGKLSPVKVESAKPANNAVETGKTSTGVTGNNKPTGDDGKGGLAAGVRNESDKEEVGKADALASGKAGTEEVQAGETAINQATSDMPRSDEVATDAPASEATTSDVVKQGTDASKAAETRSNERNTGKSKTPSGGSSGDEASPRKRVSTSVSQFVTPSGEVMVSTKTEVAVTAAVVDSGLRRTSRIRIPKQKVSV